MSDEQSSPLLRAGPKQDESDRSSRLRSPSPAKRPEESTPLLSRNENNGGYGDAPIRDEAGSRAASSLRSLQDGGFAKGKSPMRWPTKIALTIMSLVFIVILCLGFAAPAVVEEYAKQAMVFEPTDLSIDSFTHTGVKARIRGGFTLDGSRVARKPVRDLGRAGTWLARAVRSGQSKVQVYLPEYDNLLLGTANIPPIVVDIRDGHTTHMDFLSDLKAGNLDGIRRMAMDWIEGRIAGLTIKGVADVPLKSGIFSLGTQSLVHILRFDGKSIKFGWINSSFEISQY